MDPNACYKRLWDAFMAEEWGELAAACVDLAGWIGRGGFLPTVPHCPPVLATFDRAQWTFYLNDVRKLAEKAR